MAHWKAGTHRHPCEHGTVTPPNEAPSKRQLDSEIARLALPALGALIAEPLFLITDTALVGHLGATPLAAIGAASTIVQTALGLLLFLAYATTPTVARRLGAGDRPGAVSAGIDGMWLAAGLGVILLIAGVLVADPLGNLLASTDAVARQAALYIRISALGLPSMLVVIAATGLLRGLQDTKTPLYLSVGGFAVNGALNAILIYGAHLGIAGSALGTVIAQTGMAIAVVIIAVRAARKEGVSIRPGLDGVSSSALQGGWMFVRNLTIRIALLAIVWAAATIGVHEQAALQVAFTLFSTYAFALDALAIAAQAMLGHALGAGNEQRARNILRRLLFWGAVCGAGLGIVLCLTCGILGRVFTADAAVLALLPALIAITGVTAPLGGLAFVLDGVLMGAGDSKYLAFAGCINLAVEIILVIPILLMPLWMPGADPALRMSLLWAAYSFGYLGVRTLTLSLRVRTGTWVRLGIT